MAAVLTASAQISGFRFAAGMIAVADRLFTENGLKDISDDLLDNCYTSVALAINGLALAGEMHSLEADAASALNLGYDRLDAVATALTDEHFRRDDLKAMPSGTGNVVDMAKARLRLRG